MYKVIVNTKYGRRVEECDSDDLLEIQDNVVREFAHDAPDAVMTKCVMVCRWVGTEDEECVLSVTFVNLHNYKVLVSAMHMMYDQNRKPVCVDVQFLEIDNSRPGGDELVLSKFSATVNI